MVDYLRASGFAAVERHLTGSGQGDVGGLPLPLVLECKNHERLALGTWMTQLEASMDRAGCSMGAIVHKRARKTDPGLQLVTMDLESFVYLLQQATGKVG